MTDHKSLDKVVFERAEIDALFGDIVKIHRVLKNLNPGNYATSELGFVVEHLLEKKVRGSHYRQVVFD